MSYTILKQWNTMDGKYHSEDIEKSSYDSAFGELHSLVKPMMNDTNVKRFTLSMIDEEGLITEAPIKWERKEA